MIALIACSDISWEPCNFRVLRHLMAIQRDHRGQHHARDETEQRSNCQAAARRKLQPEVRWRLPELKNKPTVCQNSV